MPGVFDYAGPDRDSRYRPCSCCHSPILKTVASGMIFSELNTHPTYPLSTLRGLPHDRARARLEAEVARWAFLVKLFHLLPHAGLSRRTNIAITLTILNAYKSVRKEACRHFRVHVSRFFESCGILTLRPYHTHR